MCNFTSVKRKRKTIQIEPSLHQDLKITSARHGVTVTDLVRAIIEIGLGTPGRADAAAKRAAGK